MSFFFKKPKNNIDCFKLIYYCQFFSFYSNDVTFKSLSYLLTYLLLYPSILCYANLTIKNLRHIVNVFKFFPTFCKPLIYLNSIQVISFFEYRKYIFYIFIFARLILFVLKFCLYLNK